MTFVSTNTRDAQFIQIKEVYLLPLLVRACFLLPVLYGDHGNKLCSDVMEQRNVETVWVWMP